MLTALNVVIGLAAVYMAFSLLTSSLNEAISRALSLRANTLKAGIGRMLGDANLLSEFYKQPSVVSAQSKDTQGPSYLSASQFSLAVTGLLNTAWIIGQTGVSAFTTVTANVNALPDSRLKQVLSAILAQSGADVGQFVGGVESWFNDEMDRVSGWYRRSAQVWLFVLGALLAVAFNVDTLRLAQTFTSVPLGIDPTKISSDTSTSEKYAEQFVLSHVTLGWKSHGYCAPTDTDINDVCDAVPTGSIKDNGWWWFYKVIGMVLTAIALSLGAPFWFDTLSRFVNVRAAGPPPQSDASSS